MNRVLTFSLLVMVPTGSQALAAQLQGQSPAQQSRIVTFDSLVYFGDSLTDVGNFYAATGLPTSPPYQQGRASNGPVWAEYFAARMGLPQPAASTAGGNDYAWFGAETGTGFSSNYSTPNLQMQVAGYLGAHAPSASSLYTIWIGANDLVAAGGPPSPLVSAQNTAAAVAALEAAGARNFLVLNLPPLGMTPNTVGTLNEPLADQWCQFYNAALAADLAALDGGPNSILLFDTSNALTQMAANPAAFGLTDVIHQGIQDPTHAGTYLFWDGFHPTTTGHALLAAAIPEPSGLLLAIMSSSLLVLRRRRASRRTSQRQNAA